MGQRRGGPFVFSTHSLDSPKVRSAGCSTGAAFAVRSLRFGANGETLDFLREGNELRRGNIATPEAAQAWRSPFVRQRHLPPDAPIPVGEQFDLAPVIMSATAAYQSLRETSTWLNPATTIKLTKAANSAYSMRSWPPAPHDFFGQPSASRRMSYVPGKTARGWGLGGSPEGDRRGLSLVGARRHGAVVGAAESIRRHRVAQGGVARGPQSTPRGDGRDTLAVAWRVPRGRGGPLETSGDAHRG